MKVINDLYDYENYKIVQDTDTFKFSLDSILLAEFADTITDSLEILDLCTGNAVVPLILSYYYKNTIYGFEIQKSIFANALESVKINNVDNQIKLICDDVKNIRNYFPGNNFDVILANPPYFKYQESSIINDNMEKAVARHEIYLNLDNLFEVVNYSLKDGGAFYLVHLPERLEEILSLCEKYKIKAKKIQFIYTKKDNSANIVLLKCIKGANNGLAVNAPLLISDYKSYKNIFRR
jgi:tRNA1(Val) A37 N6-methylase TrmN6